MATVDDQSPWAVDDRYSTGQSAPAADTTNDWTLGTVSGTGINTYTLTRNLNTGDSQDYTIPDGATTMIYAYGSGTTFGQHAGGAYGAFSITVDSANRDISLGAGSLEVDSTKALLHGLFAYIAWSWFSVLLIITGRYSKYFWVFRMFGHAAVGILTLIFTIVSVGGYGEFNHANASANALGDAHTGLGGLVITWTIVISSLGVLMKFVQFFFGRFILLSYWMWYLHAIFGFILIVYAQIVLLSGLYYYDSPVTFLFYIHLGVAVLFMLCWEIIWQLKFSTWKYMHIKTMDDKNLPSMTVEEFDKSDKKLAVFDGFVIDMGNYFIDHPGGKYVLDECIKKEVGKYFYGSYSNDDLIKVWTHSYIAGKIMMKLAIAKLEQPQSIQDMMISVNNAQRIDTNDSQQAIYGNSNVFEIIEKDELCPMVYRIKLSNGKAQFKTFVPGTDTVCRHFIISSMDTNTSRYYTICNSMNSEVYDRYLYAIDQIIGRESKVAKPEGDVLEISHQLQLVLKFYPQSKKGITKQMSKAKDNDRYIVEGIFGKGLDCSAANITGQNLIFLGGTGVLPFIDLIAYLGRFLINEKSPGNNIFNNEQFEEHFKDSSFVCYAYYQRPSDAVGYSLIQAVADLYAHFGLENRFKLVPVFTREQGGYRLSPGKIDEILDEHHKASPLKNLWVCGPPPMNNMFQRIRKKIIKQYDLSNHKVEIL